MSVTPPAGTMQAMDTRALPPDSFAGLSTRQAERYSLAELIAATATGDQKTLGFYREVSDAIAAKTKQQAQSMRSYFLPAEYLQRDMTAAVAADGGHIVGQSTTFAGALLASSITARLPLRRAVLTGNGQLAVVSTAATSTWLASEAAVIGDAAMEFAARSATPKAIATTMFVSKQLDLQAPGVAGFVEAQAGAKLAQDIDKGFVQGTGADGQPTGLTVLSGTTSQSGTSLDYTGVCTMIAAAEGYGGTPHVLLGKDAAKLLRQRPKVTGGAAIFDGGGVDALPTIVSRAVPDAAMLVFDPSLVTAVQFGAIEAVVSPLATPTAFRTGAIGIRLIAMVDYMVDHPAAVAKSTSIT